VTDSYNIRYRLNYSSKPKPPLVYPWRKKMVL